MAQVSSVYSFRGGDVPRPEPVSEDLKQSARAWIAMAGINQSDGERLIDTDDLIRADQQLRAAESSLAKAREALAEALTMRGGK